MCADARYRAPLSGLAAWLLCASVGSHSPYCVAATPLESLASSKQGKMLHEGSWDRAHGNNDFRTIQPGEVLTLFEHKGAGTIQHFWMTLGPRHDVGILSQAILRMYWDDDANPSVECPLGAFFGVGFGEQRDFISLPLNETSGGYNSYWPMPFHKAARWTLTNGSSRAVEYFYYNIDYTSVKSLPTGTRHFHAQFRRENPTTAGRNYTILATAGSGHYVGTALFMSGRNQGFLEGNEMIYIDGAATPTIEGTGTEDYFGSGWYFDRGVYSAPYHGIVLKEEHPARISAYRWHVEDPIPFSQSIRFTIEHGARNSAVADYSSVAYYYLAGASPKPEPLPASLLPSHRSLPSPMSMANAIEAETLKATASTTSGDVETEYMDELDTRDVWSNGQALWWAPDGGDTNPEMTLQLPSAVGGKFATSARVVTGPNNGIVQFFFGGQPVSDPIDLQANQWEPREVALGTLALQAGSNALVIRSLGKNTRSKSNAIGIDAFILNH